MVATGITVNKINANTNYGNHGYYGNDWNDRHYGKDWNDWDDWDCEHEPYLRNVIGSTRIEITLMLVLKLRQLQNLLLYFK
jgi:hypothetical protein